MLNWNGRIWFLEEPHIDFLAYGTRAIEVGKVEWKPLILSPTLLLDTIIHQKSLIGMDMSCEDLITS